MKKEKKRLLKRSLLITVTLLLVWSPISSNSLVLLPTDKVHAESLENIEGTTDNLEEQNKDISSFLENEIMEDEPEADRSELQNILNEIRAEHLNKEDYTNESWNRFSLAIEQAESIIHDKDVSQFQIDMAIIYLNLARNGLLIPIPPIEITPIIDKEQLQQYVDQMKSLDQNMYTKSSWTRLELAIEEAEKVLAAEDASQLQVHQAYMSINRAYNGLEELIDTLPIIGDKTELEAFLQEIDDENLNREDYTDESWSEFSTALSTAELVVAYEYATQDQVNRALAQLKDAHQQLEKKFPIRPPVEPIADKTELKELIDHINAEKIDEKIYTSESWEAFQKAFTKAEEVYSSSLVSQRDVDKAIENLQAAYDNLEVLEEEDPVPTPEEPKKPTPDPEEPTTPQEPEGDDPQQTEVDKSKLEEYVNELTEKELDESLYTEDSWKSLQNAIANAENILETEESTQDDVDQALTHLKEAYENLEIVEEDVEDEEKKVSSGAAGSASDSSNDGDDKKGGNLPETATNNWNYVLAGIISVMLGLGIHRAYRFRKAL